jgi:hypothetical protein
VNDEGTSTPELRASRRSGWRVRKSPLGQEPADDLGSSTTPEERLAMMWPLALEAWTLMGAGVPDYDRRRTPVRKLDPDAA